jgi:hypothetical protein
MTMSSADNPHDYRPEAGRTLGEAANRWVTWQIVSGVIGLVLFLIFLFAFFLPMWRQFPAVQP